MVGEFPGLDRLDEDGNLRASSDFRGVYCGLLEQWFGTDAARGHAGGRPLRPPGAGALMARAVLAAAIVRSRCSGTAPRRGARARRLMVQADEYSLVLSRQSIVRGPALIQFLNRGEDPHDLKLRRTGGTHCDLGVRDAARRTGRGRMCGLRTGRYRLWCSLPGHRALGMRAKLRVRRAG